MTILLSILFFGFILGMRHATDADHVIAVATIVNRQRSVRTAAITGILWGVGHSLAVLAAGGAIILSGLVVPARLGLGLEFSVAIMLIVLGLLNLSGLRRDTFVSSEGHPGKELETTDERFSWIRDRHSESGVQWPGIRPVCVGTVHGLAGSAAVALLVVPLIREPAWALGYLLIFGLGTIIGMMLITAAIAFPFLYTGARSHLLRRWMATATALLSIGFGAFLAYEIGFVDGLFRP